MGKSKHPHKKQHKESLIPTQLNTNDEDNWF